MSTAIPEGFIDTVIEPDGGALLLSAVFGALFYGVTLVQSYLYYDRYWDDRLILKTFVAILIAFDTVQLGFLIYSAWWYLVTNYGNLPSTELVPPGIAVDVAITICMGFLVQSFFAIRVWRTSDGNTVVPIIIMILSSAQFTLGMYYTVMIQRSHYESTLAEVSWTAASGLACSMAADFLITVSLCYYLRKIRSGMLKTDRLISVIVMYTVNTGLLTSAVATCAIILTTVYSKQLWLSIPFSLVSKCYVNSVLATLNAREKLRSMHSGLVLSPTMLERSDLTGLREQHIVSEVRLMPMENMYSRKAGENDIVPDV
ncbi:hypothetical protein OBBRIDRAFT_794804 [Obba rivulosa]|uniref:DUF6534 domain-containing protein n=1 Tax=Obba rivulosa TaxID=1052685 RepID=A0A8E2DKJ1_9APHY|nr:hypothetical protein OBBRIDRAFT_794804 [Obba rivulosa]